MKVLKIIGAIILIIVIVFILCFRITINRDEDIPGRSCKVITGRITHSYIGTVTRYCSAVNCNSKREFVSGKLTKKEYEELKEQIKNKDDYNIICMTFLNN